MLRFVAAKYGPVTGFYLGNMQAVVITDFNVLKGKGLSFPGVICIFI
jgi:hypothetical protein